jgi:hypothetical protein
MTDDRDSDQMKAARAYVAAAAEAEGLLRERNAIDTQIAAAQRRLACAVDVLRKWVGPNRRLEAYQVTTGHAVIVRYIDNGPALVDVVSVHTT